MSTETSTTATTTAATAGTTDADFAYAISVTFATILWLINILITLRVYSLPLTAYSTDLRVSVSLMLFIKILVPYFSGLITSTNIGRLQTLVGGLCGLYVLSAFSVFLPPDARATVALVNVAFVASIGVYDMAQQLLLLYFVWARLKGVTRAFKLRYACRVALAIACYAAGVGSAFAVSDNTHPWRLWSKVCVPAFGFSSLSGMEQLRMALLKQQQHKLKRQDRKEGGGGGNGGGDGPHHVTSPSRAQTVKWSIWRSLSMRSIERGRDNQLANYRTQMATAMQAPPPSTFPVRTDMVTATELDVENAIETVGPRKV
ncbi:hypothetical protein BC831DRAFT_516441 [Entophlyctis helioformis]|nr:hypothetical protein BC831DRAFT_516441 [Entophlyctis helioformis]